MDAVSAAPGDAHPHTATDAGGTIVVDCPCKRCHYNLRGLSEHGRCPECGTPIGLSLCGDLLRYSDPDWLDKVARGLTIILWMILVWIIVSIAAGLIGGKTLVELAGLCVAAISFCGVWLMTEPDPSGIGEDRDYTARRVVRIFLIVGLCSHALGVSVEVNVFTGTLGTILGLSAKTGTMVSLVGEFAKFIYYEKLARRIPDDKLAERAAFLKWALTLSMGIMLLAGLFLLVPPLSAIACVGLPALLAIIVFSLMTLFMLIRLRREIIAQATAARASWAAEHVGLTQPD